MKITKSKYICILAAYLAITTEAYGAFPSVDNKLVNVSGISLGATDKDVMSVFGQPISLTKVPPQFGNIELTYKYNGLIIHTTDNRVERMELNNSSYLLPTGIKVGDSVTEVKKQYSLLWENNYGLGFVGLSDSCYIYFYHSNSAIERIKIFCAP